MSNKGDPGSDPIRSLFFKYYSPALISILSVTLHQVINAIILAQKEGKEAVTAVGLFGPVFTIFIAIALATMIGSGILFGRNIGSKNFGKAKEIFHFSTSIAILFGLILALFSYPLAKFLSGFLSGKENSALIQSSFDYMFWAFLWMPLFFIRMLWGNLISNDASPHISRNGNMIAVVCNILLDILLVIIFPFGVEGASVATGISILISLIYLFLFIKKGNGNLNFQNFKFILKLKEWKELINYGFPSFVSEISFSLGLLLINKSLIPFGVMAIAAFGIINHISFIFLRLFTSAMISALPIMSFNAGAGNTKRVMETFKFSMMFCVFLGVLVSICGFVFGRPLIHLFSGNESTEFKELAYNALSLYFLLFLAAGPNFILGAYLQTLGKSFLSSLLNVLKGIVLIAFFLFLSDQLYPGINGIWFTRAATEVTALIVIASLLLYKRSLFIKNPDTAG